jgi:hypothetical protein
LFKVEDYLKKINCQKQIKKLRQSEGFKMKISFE